MPVLQPYQLLKRCLLNDDLSVNYFLDPTDSTKKLDGTASVLTGADGQVMVQMPKLYSAHRMSGNKHIYRASLSPAPGLALHPAWTKNGEIVDYRYMGAYEGYITGGKLCSISGVLPTVSQTRAQFRAAAAARGTGWRQLDFWLVQAVQLMMVMEYNKYDMQAAIGAGLTTYPAWPNGPQALTGNSNSIGDVTGYVASTPTKWAATTAYGLNVLAIPLATQNGYTYKCTVAGTSGGTEPVWPTVIGNTVVDGGATWQCIRITGYLSYRGIENFYGHIWKFVDGINIIADRHPWVSNTDTQFADDTTTNYEDLGVTLPSTNNYQQTLHNLEFAILPASVGSNYIGDYYYQNIGNRIGLVGAGLDNGANAGAFCWLLHYASSASSAYIGGRLNA